ncbi:MAG: DUF547 domain-containing protein, partial [Cyclobacteriaceae bacterium]|nr:DUF547 domain-containing protein [Cyclobacteriaceae bacterium HetDA_MAG_MS6]
LTLLIWLNSPLTNSSQIFNDFQSFFSLFCKEGKVCYNRVKSSAVVLNQLERAIGTHSLSGKSTNYKVAFYINAYNLLCISQVIKTYPDIKSPLDVDGFFKSKKFLVAGESLSLDEIEFKRLFKLRNDARFHLVLVSASNDSPPIWSKAFQPASLEKDLQWRSEIFMNMEEFVELKGDKLEISEIFNWYRDRFEQSSGSVIAFINKYHDQSISTDLSIAYKPYDWQLNDLGH